MWIDVGTLLLATTLYYYCHRVNRRTKTVELYGNGWEPVMPNEHVPEMEIDVMLYTGERVMGCNYDPPYYLNPKTGKRIHRRDVVAVRLLDL